MGMTLSDDELYGTAKPKGVALSDDELYGSAPPKKGVALSDAELYGAAPATAPPAPKGADFSKLEGIANYLTSRNERGLVNDIVGLFTKPAAPPAPLTDAELQAAGYAPGTDLTKPVGVGVQPFQGPPLRTAPKPVVKPFVGPPDPATIQPERTVLGTGGDVFGTGLKGALGLGETVTGLLDIPTGGYAGKGVEAMGIRFKDARSAIDDLLMSDAQKWAAKQVQQADGFVPSLAAAITNPSTIGTTVLESAPSIGAAGVVGRGVTALAPRLAGLAGPIGEGVVSAGQTTEQVRQQTPGGTLSPGQIALTSGSGALTGLLGWGGQRVARRLGVADIDDFVAGTNAMPLDQKAGVMRQVVKSMIAEGLIEELPQSAQEQIAQNLALGKPWDEGVGQAAAMGTLAGAATGGGMVLKQQGPAAFKEAMRAASPEGLIASMIDEAVHSTPPAPVAPMRDAANEVPYAQQPPIAPRGFDAGGIAPDQPAPDLQPPGPVVGADAGSPGLAAAVTDNGPAPEVNPAVRQPDAELAPAGGPSAPAAAEPAPAVPGPEPERVQPAAGVAPAPAIEPEPVTPSRNLTTRTEGAPKISARQRQMAAQATSPEFNTWFEGSQVHDEEGDPLTMYHGTSEAFDSDFDPYSSDYGLFGQGSYFTADPTIAQTYTRKGKGKAPAVYATHLSLKNPIDMDAPADPAAWIAQFPDAETYHEGGDTNESWYRAAEEALMDAGALKYEGAEVMKDGLEAMGYDGVTHLGGGRRGEKRHRVYIAFHPEQVRRQAARFDKTKLPQPAAPQTSEPAGEELTVPPTAPSPGAQPPAAAAPPPAVSPSKAATAAPPPAAAAPAPAPMADNEADETAPPAEAAPPAPEAKPAAEAPAPKPEPKRAAAPAVQRGDEDSAEGDDAAARLPVGVADDPVVARAIATEEDADDVRTVAVLHDTSIPSQKQVTPSHPGYIERDNEPGGDAFIETNQAENDPDHLHDLGQPTIDEVAQTRRSSKYLDAWHALGITAGVAANMTYPAQLKLLSKALKDRYGVGVQVKPGAHKVETIAQLLDAYRNMGWMAGLLSLPDKAISLGNKITLSLERQKAGLLGYYQPVTGVMGMPGRSNSFAHEWGHALDAWITQLLGVKGILASDYGATKGLPDTTTAVGKAFAGLLSALYQDQAAFALEVLRLQNKAAQRNKAGNPTPSAQKAQRDLETLQSGKVVKGVPMSAYATSISKTGSDYLFRPTEMLARSFEAYVGYLSKQAGAINADEFITKGNRAYESTGDNYLRIAYPKDADRTAIFGAFTTLMGEVANHFAVNQQKPGMLPYEDHMAANPLDDHNEEASLLKRIWREEVTAWKRGVRDMSLKATGERFKQLPSTLADFFYATVGAQRSWLTMIEKRHKSPTVQKLGKILFRTINRENVRDQAEVTMPQETRMQVHGLHTAIDKEVLRLFGKDNEFTAADNAYLRTIMTSQAESTNEKVRDIIANAPKEGLDGPRRNKLNQLALFLRNKVMNRQLFYLRDAGISVGETVNGMLPRELDHDAVFAKPDLFVERAAEAYAINFDAAVGKGSDDFKKKEFSEALAHLGFQWKAKRDEFGKRIPPSDGEVNQATAAIIRTLRSDWAKLAYLQRQKAQLEKAGEDTAAVEGKIAGLQATIDGKIEQILPKLREDFGQTEGERWRLRMYIGGALNDFGTIGPSQAFTAHRTLPMEADTLMAPFYNPSVLDSIRNYVEQTTRRAIYAKAFGDDSVKLEDMLRQMAKEGVSPQDIAAVKFIVNSVTGRANHDTPTAFNNAMAWIQLTGTFVLLARSVFASVTEPMVMSLNTGNLVDLVRPLAYAVQSAFRTASAAQRREMAEVIGLVTMPFADAGASQRLAGDNFSRRMNKVTTQFFERSLLSPLTRWQRSSAVGAANLFLVKLSKRLDDKGSRAELSQWGIPQDKQKEFAEWLLQFGGALPDTASLIDPNTGSLGGMGKLYGQAIHEIVNHTVVDPDKIDKPALASNPVARLTFAIQGFNFAHFGKVYMPLVRRIVTDIKTLYTGAKGNDLGRTRVGAVGDMVKIAMYGIATYHATLLVTILREALFNADRWEEEEKKGTLDKWLSSLALDRMNLWGAYDPIKQALTGVKYQRDLASMMAGPYMGTLLKNIEAMYIGATKDGDVTDRKAAQAAYQSTVSVALGWGQAALPGGPVAGLLYAGANAYFGSNAAAAKAATLMGHPKYDSATQKKVKNLDGTKTIVDKTPAEMRETDLRKKRNERRKRLEELRQKAFRDARDEAD